MSEFDIFSCEDMERPRVWLKTALLPVLVDPQHLQGMGFKPSFVRRFYKKHTRVLRFDGTIARGVRGVNEVEFLRGVAEALGVRPFGDAWDPRDTATTTRVARQCLEALAALEKEQEAGALAHDPDATAETTAAEVEVQV